MVSNETKSRYGILGGGQLAQMLVEATPASFEPVVFVKDRSQPAAQICPRVIIGDWQNPQTLEPLFSEVQGILFESEFVPEAPLRELGKRFPKVEFLPGLEVLTRLRQKSAQKELLTQLRIPTSPFIVYSASETPSEWLDRVRAVLGSDYVLKWSTFGYDGKGVFLRSEDRAGALQFCEEAARMGSGLYAEQKIPFVRELALVGCRSRTGEFVAYPLVLSEQWEGICLRVQGPAVRLGLNAESEIQAANYAKSLGDATGIIGCFALEFFETESGELLVNEIAPRVHNSGHYTQDAAATSQFENHWRAVGGLALGSVETPRFFAMRNILGPDGISVAMKTLPLPSVKSGVVLHWYGKDRIESRRKLGHFNATADTIADLETVVAEMDRLALEWERVIRKHLEGN